MSLAALAIVLVQAGGLTANMNPEENLRVHALASMGTGLSVAGRAKSVLSKRSPLFFNFGAAFTFGQRSWLELEAGTQLEVEGRVGIALVPRIRAFLPLTGPLRLYAALAVPAYVYPYSLYGVQGGFGARFRVLPVLDVCADATVTGFVGGSDLVAGRSLAKFDLAFGVVMHF